MTQDKLVRETYMIYDTIRIGTNVQDNYPGRLTSFSELATAESLPFFQTRSVNDGKAYCNLTQKDSMSWPMKIESLGIKFTYPSPNADSSSPYRARRESSKLFEMIILDHMYVDVIIREDTILTLKPMMMPTGYGVVGQESREDQNTAGTYSLIATNGLSSGNNRFKFVEKMLGIPRQTPWKAVLVISQQGKDILNDLGAVQPLEINNGAERANEALIEMSARGFRYVQRRGSYYYMPLDQSGASA